MRIRDERLPWLADEPAPALAGPSKQARSGASGTTRAMWPWYLALLLLVAAVAAGAWWLGTRQREAPPPQLPVEEPLAVPVAPLDGSANAVTAEPVPEPLARVQQQAPSVPAPAVPARGTTAEPEGQVEPEAETTTEPTAESAQGAVRGRSVFPAEETVMTAPPITGPAPVVVTPSRNYRGRVVQLGAFPTRAQAEATWQRVTRRYPYLASKPKMVNTVEVRALGGGRGTRMYRLQLGTSSQAQSAVICQQLERARQSCVVVY